MNEKETAKAFDLRNLMADDIFPMFQIISKVGIKEFKTCFESVEVKSAIADMVSGKSDASAMNAIGMTVALDIASLLVTNLPKCKDDIYSLLAQLSGMDKKEIASLPLATFVEMVIAVIKKEEFKDFFQVVSKLFK